MKIATHVFASDGSGGKGFGETQWSAAARSADWQVTDATRMGSRVNLDQPVFQDTMKWYYFGFSPAAWAFGTAAGAEPGQLGPADVLGPVFRTVRDQPTGMRVNSVQVPSDTVYPITIKAGATPAGCGLFTQSQRSSTRTFRR